MHTILVLLLFPHLYDNGVCYGNHHGGSSSIAEPHGEETSNTNEAK